MLSSVRNHQANKQEQMIHVETTVVIIFSNAELKFRRRLIFLSHVDISWWRVFLEHITCPSRR